MKIELYAARHGETFANIENRLAGRDTDSQLTQNGAKQAVLLRNKLKNIHFDKVYSSPLQRATDTATIIFGSDKDICIDERLAEIGLGVMDGMTYDESSKTYPESGMLFFSNPSIYKAPINGEAIEDVIKRVSSFISYIEGMNDKTIFIQTHGYLMRVLYSCMLDKTITAVENSPHYSNCDVAHYTYDSGMWIHR